MVMNLKMSYDNLASGGLINTTGSISVYYDPKFDSFEVFDHDRSFKSNGITKADFERFVELPYDSEYTARAWSKFYELLSEDELDLVNSYPYRKGFFGFLRETGLIDTFEYARESMAESVIEDWERRNGVSPNWAKASI